METAAERPLLPSAARDHSIWLRVGTLLDGTSTTPLHDAHVVYDAVRIRFVGTDGRAPPVGLLRPEQREPDAHLPGHVLLPGLIDAHAHLFLEGGELDPARRARQLARPADAMLAEARDRMLRLAQLGFAGVRDAGDKHGVGLALSREYARTERAPMPYLDSPGAAIHHAGRYGAFMADPVENHESPMACVEARIAAGADRIKLIPTGIINFQAGRVTAAPQMTTDEIVEIATAARAHGRQTFAHASGDDGIDRVIAGGVDSVEHGFFIRDDQLARLRDLDLAWVPTFAPVHAQVLHADRLGWNASVVDHLRRILAAHAASLCRAHHLGVTIIAGSDAGSYGVAHGLGLLDELELMERAGLPSLDVINAATGNGARRLAYKDAIGRVAVGFRPRFILTVHSPLETVAHLRRPRLVVFDGNVYENGTSLHPAGL